MSRVSNRGRSSILRRSPDRKTPVGEVRAVFVVCASDLETVRGYNVNLKLAAGLLAGGLLTAAPAFSSTVVIDFEGAGGGFGSIADYYNGGLDIPVSGPASSGQNYGVHFGLDLIAVAGSDSVANAPGPGNSQMAVGGSGGDYSMSVAKGFDALSFFYSAVEDTSVTVSFLGGSSQTYTLAANTGSCDLVNGPALCMWNVASLDLGGRVATGVDFGATSALAAFDNVTVNAVPVPAAVWLMMSALGGLGVIRRKRAA